MKSTSLVSSKCFVLAALVLALFSGCSSYSYRLCDTMVSEGNYGKHSVDEHGWHFAIHHRSYDFLERAGGILVFDPAKQADGTYFLPILVDVSGKSDVTVKPTVNSPDLGIREIVVGRHREDPSRILVFVHTAPISKDAPTPISRGIHIGKLTPGKYTVEYIDLGGATTVLRKFAIAQ